MLDLDPGVDPDHVRAVAVEADRLRRGDRAGEVGAVHRGLGGDPFARLGLGRRGREDAAAHRAAVADVADQGAGVDAADRRRRRSRRASRASRPRRWRRPRGSWRRA